MTEPATAAALVVQTGTVVIAGAILGIPADALLAGVWGAAISLTSAQWQGPTFKVLAGLAATFGMSLGLAVFVGPSLAHLLATMLDKWVGIDLPIIPARMGVCFLLALGAQRIAPAIIDRVVGEVKNREVPNDDRS